METDKLQILTQDLRVTEWCTRVHGPCLRLVYTAYNAVL